MNHTGWISRFETNRLGRQEPDWHAPCLIPAQKRRMLARSLAEYQLGDGGGECRLIASDAESVRSSGDAARLIDLWFAEEREHSRLLACAVRRVSGEFVTSTFAFRLFNFCRRIFSVDFEMLVLLIVEIVSTGYYRVIARHCGDAPLEAMCDLIIGDELLHIAFHRDRLADRGVPSRLWVAFFQLLGYACAAFLWLGHGRCFRTLGATPAELFREVRSGLGKFLDSLWSVTNGVHRAGLADRPSSSSIVSHEKPTEPVPHR